jgi:hypothetical protein
LASNKVKPFNAASHRGMENTENEDMLGGLWVFMANK